MVLWHNSSFDSISTIKSESRSYEGYLFKWIDEFILFIVHSGDFEQRFGSSMWYEKRLRIGFVP